MQRYQNFFTEDHFSFRELATEYAETRLRPIAMEIDETDHFPEDVIYEMADMGFFGLKIPEEYGGSGMDIRSYTSVMEEIAKGSSTACVLISAANSLAAAPLILYGAEEQKKKYLPGIVDFSAPVAFGLTEPSAGSDAGSLKTRAVKDGDFYVLNGSKTFITLAPIAKYAVIFAKTEPDAGVKGITAFMVDMSLPGVSCGKKEKKMGQKGIPVSDITLEDVRVSKKCMIGEEGKGFINAMKTLDIGRVGVSSMSLGIAQRAMDITIAYLKERVQFGKPLAKMQALQFMMADCEARLNAARCMLYNTAWLMDNNIPATKDASMTKYFVTETCQDIVNKCLQMFGGYGYSEEYEIERLYRDIRVNTIYEGSSQVQQIVIAGNLFRS